MPEKVGYHSRVPPQMGPLIGNDVSVPSRTWRHTVYSRRSLAVRRRQSERHFRNDINKAGDLLAAISLPRCAITIGRSGQVRIGVHVGGQRTIAVPSRA